MHGAPPPPRAALPVLDDEALSARRQAIRRGTRVMGLSHARVEAVRGDTITLALVFLTTSAQAPSQRLAEVGRFTAEKIEHLPRELVALVAGLVPFEQPTEHDERYRAEQVAEAHRQPSRSVIFRRG